MKTKVQPYSLVLTSLVVLTLSVTALTSVSAQAQNWRVTKSEWTPADELDYSRFVAAIGEAKELKICLTTQECIQMAPGNFLRNSDDANLKMDVDCAMLPYALRSYFAMKRGLPFSHIKTIAPALGADGLPVEVKDIRYSTNGNVVTSRKDIVSGSRSYSNALQQIRWGISSGSYRMHPDYESYDLPQDMYSVDIRKGSESDLRGIRPGTNIYDPAGHVAVVYKVGKSGRIFYIDAHPDNSLTRGSYGMKFVRSRPAAGAGFKNFRPLRVENGHALLGSNQYISDYSTVQYFGTTPGKTWGKGTFELNGQRLSYYEYVRAVMANGNTQVDPVFEMTEMMDGLCLDVQDRMHAVKESVEEGISLKAHPSKLPSNIYGTGGEWESFSTPSRDARLKVSFKELHDTILNWLALDVRGDRNLVYAGGNLKADLQATYQKAVRSCALSYTTSAGKDVRFTMNDVQDHLFDLSFSPYQCAELRWGGIGGTPASCLADPAKAQWYQAERKLRNQLERTYDVKMDYSAQDLLTGAGVNLGVERAPDVDIRRALQ